MIELIKGGKKRFVMLCEVCDAEFAYEIDDVIGRTVRCPCCGEYCRHYPRNKSESEVAARIFEEIEKILDEKFSINHGVVLISKEDFAELKKKYIGDKQRKEDEGK